MRVLTTKHSTLDPLKGVPISVIGYGAQGRAQALCLKDSGLDVTVGARPGGPSFHRAVEDGLRVLSIAKAAQQGKLIHILIPDECQKEIYDEHIASHVSKGDCLSFSHGFSIVYERIRPPKDVDVILVAPKSPGTEERKAYLEGFGVPGLIAVDQDTSGEAKDKALAFAHALGLTRAGVLECSFREEVFEDLFGNRRFSAGDGRAHQGGFRDPRGCGIPRRNGLLRVPSRA